MNTLIDQFISNLNTGDIWAGFLMLAIFYVLKKEPFKIFAHYNEKRIKDIDQAKSLLESDKLGKESNELLREHLEHYSFQKFYGISANKDMRSTLLKFYQKHQDTIGWSDLKRAYSFIKPEGPSIRVKLSLGNHLGRWAVTSFSWFIGLYSLLIIILAFISKPESQLQFIALTFLSVALLVAAMLFSSMNWPYHSALKIQDCIDKDSRKN